MHNLDLILTLTYGLIAALVCGYISQRIGLSPIVGYLVGGLILGPYTPGFIADHKIAEQLAELGVILLMFGVGLHFHLEELLAVRGVALPGAIAQSLVATILGMLVTRAFGWGWDAGLVFGMALSVASTVVLVRVLSDNRDLHTLSGHIAVGWLVVEDLFTVVALVVLPAVYDRQGDGNLWLSLSLAGVKVVALVFLTFAVGGRVVPWLLEQAAKTRSRELFTLTVLALALGIAVGSAQLFGVSMALGAFLAGMVVGRSEFSLRAASEALPMRDAFAVLFFVSVGMLLDPMHLLREPGLVAATVAVVMLGKPLIALFIVLVLRYPTKSALAVSVALAQIGEFSFILAALGKQLGLLDVSANNTLVAAAIISITLNPILYRYVDPFDAWAINHSRFWRWLNQRVRKKISASAKRRQEDEVNPHRAIVVGYGPIGRSVVRLLRENEVEPTIIELNVETVRRLSESGITAIYGDAAHRDTLASAGAATAANLILSSAGMQHSQEVIRVARELNPDIHVLARANYLGERTQLMLAGADEVFSAEGEVALAFSVSILRRLGATPEQVDRERQWVYADLLGQPLVTDDVADPAVASAASESESQTSGNSTEDPPATGRKAD
jgi:CPA2 family monovalent cation:H+ antiporter-2